MCKYALFVAGPWTRRYAFKSASSPFCKLWHFPRHLPLYLFPRSYIHKLPTCNLMTVLSSRALWAKLRCLWSVCRKPGSSREKVMPVIKAVSQASFSMAWQVQLMQVTHSLRNAKRFEEPVKCVCAHNLKKLAQRSGRTVLFIFFCLECAILDFRDLQNKLITPLIGFLCIFFLGTASTE